MAVVVVENGNRPLVNNRPLANNRPLVLFSYPSLVFLYSVQLFYPCVLVQSAVYILSRPSVPGKVNFLNLLEHILISKANDSVKIKPNKSSSIGMLSVWFSAPEPGIREV